MDLPVNTNPTRYTDRDFPPYRFVPGETPHPTRDPRGHSFNKPQERFGGFAPEHWDTCHEYLYGIDLFNYRYWWEAHEALETVWVAAGRRTETGLFIQGLIQIAVAHLKWSQGFYDTARRMASDGLGKMKLVYGVCLGIDVVPFRSGVKKYFAGETQTLITIELVLPIRAGRC